MANEPIKVTRQGELVGELAVERIPLDYPELSARPEANMAFAPDGDIWAAIGHMCSETLRPERLFHSKDGGRTWTSQVMAPAETHCMHAFTVLNDYTMLLFIGKQGTPEGRTFLEAFTSKDQGQTWQSVSTIFPDPLDNVSGGFDSLTQLRDGTVIYPFVRRSEKTEIKKGIMVQHVIRSTDGGHSWEIAEITESDLAFLGASPEDRCPGMGGTFPGCCESQILELADGKLLAAFRYQPFLFELPWYKDKAKEWGGKPYQSGEVNCFKHVFLGDSLDGGRTWQNLRPLRDAEGNPLLEHGECHGQLVQVPDGRVVLVHDRRYPYECCETRARVSLDGGQTWKREIFHLSPGSCYPSSVALQDGTIITVINTSRLDPSAKPLTPWNAEVLRWRLPDKM
jgi:hypothetical protein